MRARADTLTLPEPLQRIQWQLRSTRSTKQPSPRVEVTA